MTSPQAKLSWKTVAQAAVIIIVAASIKAFYSTANVNDLTWILWPTRIIVEQITATRFHFESYVGYMSADRSFLIAAACSGVNFLIAIFLMLSLQVLWRRRNGGISWLSIFWIAVLSYVITIVANSLRISSALWLISATRELAGLDREELHRLDGIIVYFGMMLLAYLAFERLQKKGQSLTWRNILFPLSIYYSITLAVPLVNGAFRNSEFLKHSFFVLVTPILFIGLFLAFRRPLFRDAEREGVAASASLLPRGLGVDEVCSRSNV